MYSQNMYKYINIVFWIPIFLIIFQPFFRLSHYVCPLKSKKYMLLKTAKFMAEGGSVPLRIHHVLNCLFKFLTVLGSYLVILSSIDIGIYCGFELPFGGVELPSHRLQVLHWNIFIKLFIYFFCYIIFSV